MAVVYTEMESFLSKFSMLATNGIDAVLTINCSGGKVSTNLKADLGYVNASFSPKNRPAKPSRLRRRQRREAERAVIKEDVASENVAETVVDLIPLSNITPKQPDKPSQEVTSDLVTSSSQLLPDKLKMIDRATLTKPELSMESLPSVDIPPGKRPTLSIAAQSPTSIPPRIIYHPAIINACYAITGKHLPSKLLPDEVKRFKKYLDQKREMGEPVETDLLYLPTSMRNCIHCGHPT